MTRAGKRPQTGDRFLAFSGPEERLKEEALAARIAERVSPEDRDLDVQYFDASAPGFAVEGLLQAARDVGMFSPRRVIVIRRAEQLRERRHERGRQLLAKALETLPESAHLFFITGPEEEGGGGRGGGGPLGEGLTAALKKHGRIENFTLLKPDELARRAGEHARSLGKRLLPAAAGVLARRAGPTLTRVIGEVEKLASYVGEAAEIREADVDALVAAPVEESIFTLLTQAALGRQATALQALERLLQSGEPPQKIMPMLARTLRQLLQARFLREHRIRPQAGRDDLPAELRARLPEEGDLYATAAQPWQRQRLWDQAGRFGWPQLRAAVDQLALAEAGTKGWEAGPQDAALALELFVVRLCEAAARRGG